MSDTLPEDTSTSAEITVGGSFRGTIDFSLDRDWMRVELRQGLTYDFTLNSAAPFGLSDPFLELRDAQGILLTSNDDGGGPYGLNSHISFVPSSTGSFYLAARDLGFATGDYDLTVSVRDDAPGGTDSFAFVSTAGFPTTGTIEQVGDDDWYQVTLFEGVTYDLRARSAAVDGLGDPVLRLFDLTGAQLAFNDDFDDLNSRIVFTPTATSQYYLGVRGFGDHVGTYEVSADIHDDFGGTTETASFLAVDGGPRQGSLEKAGDHDWFSIFLSAGTTYQISVEGAPVNGLPDSTLTLRDAFGSELQFNDDSNGTRNSFLTFTPTFSGMYYADVAGFGNFNTGAYSVNARTAELLNTIFTTGVMASDGTPSFSTIDTIGDEDWFFVNLEGGIQYDLRAGSTGVNGVQDTILTLYDANGFFLASNDDDPIAGSHDSYISYNPALSGGYFLGVRGFNTRTGDYSVSAAPAVAPDDYAANTFTNGFLNIDGPSQSGALETFGDNDWFRVFLAPDHTYEFALTGQLFDGLAAPALSIYDASGFEIGFNDNSIGSPAVVLPFTPTFAGTYYVDVRGAFGGHVGNYVLSGTSTLINTFDDFAGSSLTTGTLTVDGASALGSLETFGDQDWFRVVLDNARSYDFVLTGQPGGLPAPALSIHNEAGVEIAFNDNLSNNGSASLHFAPVVGGTYFVSARSPLGSFLGGYSLTSTSTPLTDDFAGSSLTTGTLVVDGNAAVGSLETFGDHDWFRVVLDSAHSYDFNLAGLAGGLATPALSILNQSGLELAFNDNILGSASASLHFTPSASGTYFVDARGVNDAAVGGYTLTSTSTVLTETDDYSDTTATSGALVVNGGPQAGTLENLGDHDWFAVTLTAGINYRFTLDHVVGGLLDDAYFTLRDASGLVIAVNDDGGHGPLDSMLTFTPEATGTYYADAGAFADNDTGDYLVSVNVVDDYAGNVGTTGVVEPNGTPQHGTIESVNDRDWLRVTLDQGIAYDFHLTRDGDGLADPLLRLLDSDGNQIATNDDGGGSLNAQLHFVAPASGTYYLEARDSDAGVGSYTLEATTADDFSADTSTRARLAAGRLLTGNIEYTGDEDWVRMSMRAGVTYTIRLQGAPTDHGTLSDPYIRGIYNRAGELLSNTSNDDFGGSYESQVTFTPRTTGHYYVAAGAYGTNTGTYDLSWSYRNPTDILASTRTRSDLRVGSEATSSVERGGDTDWYRVNLRAGVRYIIDLQSDSSSSHSLDDPLFRGVYSSTGRLIARTTNDNFGIGSDSHVVFTPRTSGTYYLSAGGARNATGEYTLGIERASNNIDALGHTAASAGTLRVGATGRNGSIDFARDVDWFRVSLNGDTDYTIDLGGRDSGTGTLRDPRMIGMYTSNGQLLPGTGLDDSAGTTDVHTNFRPSSSGVYFIAVGAERDLAGTYHIGVTPASTLDETPSNVTSQASVGVGSAYVGQLEQPQDVDWVRVNLSAGDRYTIQLEGASSNHGTLADPRIDGVFDAAGRVIEGSANDDFGGTRDAQVTFTAPTSGAYFVAAGAYGSGTGSYTLSIAAANVSDAIAPTLVSVTPNDGETGVSVGSNLVLLFDEDVRSGSGEVLISGGADVRHISVSSPEVVFSGNSLVINPATNLASGTNYTVTLGAGAVEDVAGNDFAGIVNNTQFNFSTQTAQATGSVDQWTLMVYVAADNNLEGFGVRDINEMESVVLPNNVNVVVMFDRAPGYDSSNGNWTGTRRGAITHDNNTNVISSNLVDIGEQNTGNPNTLTGFINWSAAHFAANHYGLIVWDHGGGLNGSAWDESSNGDNLSARDLRTALGSTSVNLDLIGFDACLMGMMETAWDLRAEADVLVASQELIPGDGWAYDRWLSALATNSSMSATELGRVLVNTYAAEYAGQSDITLSAVQTSGLGALENAIDQFATRALAASTADLAAIRQAAGRTEFMDSADWNYLDLGDFMHEVSSRVSAPALATSANAVIEALDAAVFANAGSVAEASGLSIYLPYGSEPVSASYTPVNHTFLSASSWDQFLAVV